MRISKSKKEQLQECIDEVNFRYNTKSEEYPQLTTDINELAAITKGNGKDERN